MTKSTAWMQGYRAYIENASHLDNIYTVGSLEWTEWDNGWWDAAECIEGCA